MCLSKMSIVYRLWVVLLMFAILTIAEPTEIGMNTSLSAPRSLLPQSWLCGESMGGTYRYSFKIHCFCDKLCHFYHDCCYRKPDRTEICATSIEMEMNAGHTAPGSTPTPVIDLLHHNSTNVSVEPRLVSLVNLSSCTEIARLQKAEIRHSLPDEYKMKIWMVDQCPPPWPDDQVRSHCSNVSDTPMIENILMHQPVTDLETMFTYRNKYCALCNGVGNGGEPWDLSIICAFPQINLGNFLNCSSSLCVIRMLLGMKTCAGIFESRPNMHPRYCFREREDHEFGPCAFSESSETGSLNWATWPFAMDSPLRDACLSYTNLVEIHDKTFYKNLHCLACYRGITPCKQDDNSNDLREIQHISFRAILNLNDGLEKETPVLNTLVCPPGYMSEGQECRPIMKNITGIRHIITLEFDPIEWHPENSVHCASLQHNPRLKDVTRALDASTTKCETKKDLQTGIVSFSVSVLISFKMDFADYAESLEMAACVKAEIEDALENVTLHMKGGPVRVRQMSKDACSLTTLKPPTFSTVTSHTTRKPAPKNASGDACYLNWWLVLLMLECFVLYL